LIRPAAPEEAPLIADLSRATFYETFAAQNTPANMDKFMNEQFTREALIREVYDPGNIFLVAAEEDKIIGYARLREDHPPAELDGKDSIEIARIYAATSAIGKGVGSALMQHCIRVAGEKKKEVIWLGVWEHNRRAIDFYTRWGFEKFGTHVFLLGDDPQTDWLMKKELPV
jgi:ribosomal protein S18 acetylase RimI-like enzyme